MVPTGYKQKATVLVGIFLIGSGSDARHVALRDTEGQGEQITMVGVDGNANAYPFPEPISNFYDRFVANSGYDYFPIPVSSVYDVPPGTPGANIATGTSLTSAHYYNTVSYMLMRYFNFSPPENYGSESDQAWLPPADSTLCERRMDDCTHPAYARMRHDFMDTGLLETYKVLNEWTSDTMPCNFTHANSVDGEEFGLCLQTLGLSGSDYFNQASEIYSGLDHMFDNTHGAFATQVSTTTGDALGKVPVTGYDQIACGTGIGFSFGVGYNCLHFQDCKQPGLTNNVIAASMLRSRDKLACEDKSVNYIAQWEVANIFAKTVGVDPKSVNMTTAAPKFCTDYDGFNICMNIVGNPVQEGDYIGTDSVNDQMAGIIADSGRKPVAVFANPEHLPRVYRSSIKSFQGKVDGTIYPAIIPFDLNSPITAHGSLINLFEGSAFFDGPNFGMYPDSAQPWTRDRTIFRLYELSAYPDGDGLRHPADWYGYKENQDE